MPLEFMSAASAKLNLRAQIISFGMSEAIQGSARLFVPSAPKGLADKTF
jgi:hypothetical protein